MNTTVVADTVDESSHLLSGRTQEIQAAIIADAGVATASDVTVEHLTEMSELILVGQTITSLQSDDLDGLTALEAIILYDTAITSLPPGVFDSNTALIVINMHDNEGLTSLPSGIFDNNTALIVINMSSNSLSSLPQGVFDKLNVLADLGLSGNNISDVSELEELTSLTSLALAGNPISDYGPLRRLIAANRYVDIDITIPDETDKGAPQLAKTTPAVTTLLTNYPNPANSETWIPYQLAKPSDITITIYNMRGVVVRQLSLGQQSAGVYHSRSHAAYWDGKNEQGEKVASGVYFYRLTAGNFSATRIMLIRK